MVHVAVWAAPEEDLSVGVRAVVHRLAENSLNRRLGSDLPDNVDTSDLLSGPKRATGEHAEPFDTGRPDFDFRHVRPSHLTSAVRVPP